MKRSLVLLAALALVSATPAHAADGVTLTASAKLVRFPGRIVLRGSAMPIVPGEPVTILEGTRPVWSGVTAVDGTFTATVAVRRAAAYVAVAGPASSAPVQVRVRPRLRAGVRGAREDLERRALDHAPGDRAMASKLSEVGARRQPSSARPK